MAILMDLKDPRVRHVTVTSVEVAPDMRTAKVLVSVMGDDTQQRLSLIGLRNSAGFLQAKLKSRIDTRYIPRLDFQLDQGVKKSIEVARILSEVLPATEAGVTGAESGAAEEALAAEDAEGLEPEGVAEGEETEEDRAAEEVERAPGRLVIQPPRLPPFRGAAAEEVWRAKRSPQGGKSSAPRNPPSAESRLPPAP